MKFNLLAFVAASTAAVSVSMADFTVTATQGPSADGMDRYDVVAVNNGNGSGSLLKAMEYFYAGTKAFFEVLDTPDDNGVSDGVPDTVNMHSSIRTRVRVSPSALDGVLVAAPTTGFMQPNPYRNGISYFEGAIATTANVAASGSGFEIARIYVANGGGGRFYGKVGGDLGQSQAFSVNFGPSLGNAHLPTMSTVGDVEGQIVPGGVSFSFGVTVSDEDASDELSVTLGALGGLNNVQVVGGGAGTQMFQVSGFIVNSNVQPRFQMRLVADDGRGGTTAQNVFVVVPEPASCLVLCAGLLATGRRRHG